MHAHSNEVLVPPDPAFDFGEKKTRPRKATTIRSIRGTRGWAYTQYFFALVASLACFAALVVLLIVYDKKPIFDNGVVTLNTIVAILSTATKAMLFHAVGDAIGQWKWITFSGSNRRRLLDFERIDSAGRGPLGSLQLLLDGQVKRV